MSEKKTQIPVVSIVGRAKSGKTTVLEGVLRELKSRGYKVATIKHHAHPGFEIDYPGKDTWRHAQAGSDYVVIAAPDKVAYIQKVEREPSLDELAARIEGVDIILTDGYRREKRPKIEVLRDGIANNPESSQAELLAVVSDGPISLNIPCFSFNQVTALVELVVHHFSLDSEADVEGI